MLCAHTVCDKCVIQWIVYGNTHNRLKCPVCRQNMFPIMLIPGAPSQSILGFTQQAVAPSQNILRNTQQAAAPSQNILGNTRQAAAAAATAAAAEEEEDEEDEDEEEDENEEEDEDEEEGEWEDVGETSRRVEQTRALGTGERGQETDMGRGQRRVLDAIRRGGGGGGGGGGAVRWPGGGVPVGWLGEADSVSAAGARATWHAGVVVWSGRGRGQGRGQGRGMSSDRSSRPLQLLRSGENDENILHY
jgi:hypothetical protein